MSYAQYLNIFYIAITPSLISQLPNLPMMPSLKMTVAFQYWMGRAQVREL